MSVSQRRLTAAGEMRALAHPLRMRLLELLAAEGAFTASEAARRLADTPANVSWHLRKLASYGFVRQSAGAGRAKPWKLVAQALTLGEDADDLAAATALTDLLLDRELQILRASLRRQPAEPTAWRDATAVRQTRLWLTPAEAADLGQRLADVFESEPLVQRSQDPALRPPGARLMAMVAWLVPYDDRVAESAESAESAEGAGA